MKKDPKTLRTAEIDVDRVRFSKGNDLGVEFTNEIDAWARMEFKFMHQIRQLRHYGVTITKNHTLDDGSFYYGFREKLD
jgi:hypothetical protein